MTPSPGSDTRFFGFTRGEWRAALGSKQAAALDQFFDGLDALRESPLALAGGLTTVGYPELACLARVSPAFADRVAEALSAHDPEWRRRLREAAGGDPEHEAARAELRRLLAER